MGHYSPQDIVLYRHRIKIVTDIINNKRSKGGRRKEQSKATKIINIKLNQANIKTPPPRAPKRDSCTIKSTLQEICTDPKDLYWCNVLLGEVMDFHSPPPTPHTHIHTHTLLVLLSPPFLVLNFPQSYPISVSLSLDIVFSRLPCWLILF